MLEAGMDFARRPSRTPAASRAGRRPLRISVWLCAVVARPVRPVRRHAASLLVGADVIVADERLHPRPIFQAARRLAPRPILRPSTGIFATAPFLAPVGAAGRPSGPSEAPRSGGVFHPTRSPPSWPAARPCSGPAPGDWRPAPTTFRLPLRGDIAGVRRWVALQTLAAPTAWRRAALRDRR